MAALIDVADLITRQSPPSLTYNEAGDGLAFFQGKTDFGSRHPTPKLYCRAPLRIAKPRDILISVRAPVGPTNIADRECCIGRGLAAIRARDIDGAFLYFNLRYIERLIASLGSGSTFHAINKSQLASVEVNSQEFGLPEQQKISAVLGLVQRAIEQQERLIVLTAKLKKALLYKLFTEGLRGETPKTNRNRPCAAELGRKETWRGDLRRSPKRSLQKQHRLRIGTRILRINDFSNDGDVVTSAPNQVTADAVERDLYALRKDDIVTNRVNSLSHLGKTALVGELTEPMIFESNMMRFRVAEQRAIPLYYLAVAQLSDM